MKAALFTAACWAVILCSAGNPGNQEQIDATPSAPPDDIIGAKIAEIQSRQPENPQSPPPEITALFPEPCRAEQPDTDSLTEWNAWRQAQEACDRQRYRQLKSIWAQQPAAAQVYEP